MQFPYTTCLLSTRFINHRSSRTDNTSKNERRREAFSAYSWLSIQPCWWCDTKEYLSVILLAPAYMDENHCLVYLKRMIASQEYFVLLKCNMTLVQPSPLSGMMTYMFVVLFYECPVCSNQINAFLLKNNDR